MLNWNTDLLLKMNVYEMRIVQLRAELKRRELDANGLKATLQQRLADAISAEAERWRAALT